MSDTQLLKWGILIDAAILIALLCDVYYNYHILKIMQGNGGQH